MGTLLNLSLMLGTRVTRVVNSQLYDWILAVTNFIEDFNQQPAGIANVGDASGGLRSSGADAINNLIESNISFPEWANPQGTRKLTHIKTIDTVLDGTWVNPLANTGGVGEFNHIMTPCPGSTGGTFGVRMVMPTGVANNTVQLLLLDTNGATVLLSTVVTVTQQPTTYTLVCPGLVPNHLYFLAIRTNHAAQQANPIINVCSFTPNGGTGTFAFDPVTGQPNFVRLGLSQNLATGNHLAGWFSNVYAFVNTAADYILNTNARTFAVEAYNNASDGQFWCLYGGKPYKESNVIPNGGLNIQDFTDLPLVQNASTDIDLDPRPVTLTVRCGIATGPVTGATPNPWGAKALITVPRAIYVPGGAAFAFQQNNADATCIYTGDSTSVGAGNVDAGFQGFAIGMRDWYPGNVICESYISQALFNFVGAGNDPAKQKNYALYLSRNRPRDHVFDLALNDKGVTGVGLWPVAQFQAALLGVVTNLLNFNPDARIWLKSPCITTIEGANNLGDTMPNYRTAIQAVVTTLNDVRVNFIDGLGANFAVVGDLLPGDPVHFNATGLAKNREAMLIILSGTTSLLGQAV